MKITQQHLELKQLDHNNLTTKEIAAILNVSIGKAHSLKHDITTHEIDMKKYEFNEAVIWAAGWGSRLNPITLTTPKPLIVVNGTSMLESNIKALVRSGIENITIVTGNMSEKFDGLVKKYKINKIINNDWMRFNNISSASAAKKLLDRNVYIIDGDLSISEEFTYSKYLATSTAFSTISMKQDEYTFFKYGKRVVGLSKFKPTKEVEQYVGIFGIHKKDAELIRDKIEESFPETPSYDDRFWNEILMEQCKNKKIKMLSKVIKLGEVIEIDTVDELIKIDKSYKDKIKMMQQK